MMWQVPVRLFWPRYKSLAGHYKWVPVNKKFPPPQKSHLCKHIYHNPLSKMLKKTANIFLDIFHTFSVSFCFKRKRVLCLTNKYREKYYSTSLRKRGPTAHNPSLHIGCISRGLKISQHAVQKCCQLPMEWDLLLHGQLAFLPCCVLYCPADRGLGGGRVAWGEASGLILQAHPRCSTMLL